MGIRQKLRRQGQGATTGRGRSLPLIACAAVTVALGVPASLTSAGAAVAAVVPQPVDCPSPTPIADVVAGMNATGWTVSSGTAAETFSAAILGRVADGIAPGVDMILARVSSPALTKAGGVWQGMSGSPVYAEDGTLIGSLSYTLGINTFIAGITPAAALMTLLSSDPDNTTLGASPATASGSKASGSKATGSKATGSKATGSKASAKKVAIPKATLTKLLAAGAVTPAQAAQGFTQLRMPFTVGTMSATGASRWAKRLADRTGIPVMTGARASSTDVAPAGSIVGGSNFAAIAAYGYASLGAIGTTTFTCQGRAVAFGHPFLNSGVNTYSIQAASTVTVADDTYGGPFKVVNFGGIAGTVDRDRTVGLRGIVGTAPAAPTVIQSSMTRVQTGGQTGGTTYAVTRDLLPDAAAFHALANVDKVMGSASAKGSFTGSLSVTGTRANGAPFILNLGNTFASLSSLAFPLDYAVGNWVYSTLSTLLDQDYEDVSISQVSLTGTATSAPVSWRAPALRVLQAGKYVEPTGRLLTANAGSPLSWRIGFTKTKSSETIMRATSLKAPKSASGTTASLVVQTSDTYDGSPESNFTELLSSLQNAPRNDEVRIEMRASDGDAQLAWALVRFPGVVESFEGRYRVQIR